MIIETIVTLSWLLYLADVAANISSYAWTLLIIFTAGGLIWYVLSTVISWAWSDSIADNSSRPEIYEKNQKQFDFFLKSVAGTRKFMLVSVLVLLPFALITPSKSTLINIIGLNVAGITVSSIAQNEETKAIFSKVMQTVEAYLDKNLSDLKPKEK